MLFRLLFSNSNDPILNIVVFSMVAGALVISLAIHEFAHAYVADKLGDPTAKYLGRVTLNPIKHLDPIGTLLLFFAGFGWGKPVPFNPGNFKNPKRDSALVSFAGPASNFVLAIIFALILRVLPQAGLVSQIFGTFLYFVIFYNLLLGIFNLIPVHPLDGFKVVNGLLPYHLSYQWMETARYGIIILLILVFTGTTDRIIGPILSFSSRILGISY